MITHTRPHWSRLAPWQTNLGLLAMGIALIWFAGQLLRESDVYYMGFSGASSSSFILYLGALLILLLKPSSTNRWTLPIILIVAALCRLVVVLPDPFLSTDVYRYAWDGVVQHAHINPYRYVPGSPELAFLRAPNQDLFDHINRRDYAHTIYPPVAQLCFYLITAINPTVVFMKFAMVLFEIPTICGLLLLFRHLGIRREYIIFYAWCPLLTWEFASSGHLDSIVCAFLVFTLLFRLRRRPVLTGLFFALAVLTKFYPLVLLPAIFRRSDWKMPATFAAVTAVTYALYSSAGAMVLGFLGGYVDEEGMATGSRYFLLEAAQHIPGLHALPNAVYIVFAAAVMAALTLWAWTTCTRDSSPPAAFLPPAFALAFAMMLLFSPHYPWYIAWLIPFVPLMPSLTAITYIGGLFYLCTTALAVGTGPKQFTLNCILYSAVLIAFLAELTLRRAPLTRRRFAQNLPLQPVLRIPE